MIKKILSISIIISLLCFGIMGCGSKISNKDNANNNSNQSSTKEATSKEATSKVIQANTIISSDGNLDIKNLKNLSLNTKLTDLMIDNFKSEKEIKKIIVTEKIKKEDKSQKDIYIFVCLNKIDDINSENVAKKVIDLITNNESDNFWKNNTGIVVFKNNEIGEDSKDFKIYSQYITKQGSNELVPVKNK